MVANSNDVRATQRTGQCECVGGEVNSHESTLMALYSGGVRSWKWTALYLQLLVLYIDDQLELPSSCLK